jgi:hypothetical protein
MAEREEKQYNSNDDYKYPVSHEGYDSEKPIEEERMKLVNPQMNVRFGIGQQQNTDYAQDNQIRKKKTEVVFQNISEHHGRLCIKRNLPAAI